MSTSDQAALTDLLLSLFNADELRRFLRHGPAGDLLERALPGPTASAAAIADGAVQALISRGLVDDALFARLEAERSGRRADVQRVRALFRRPIDRDPGGYVSSTPNGGGLSVAILVALQEELDVLRTAFAAGGVQWSKPSRDPDGGFDLPFEGPAGSGVIRLLGQMGPEAAGRVTDRVIRRWGPRFVVNIGIAGSLGSLRLGDVLVARQVDGYLTTGRVSDGPAGPQFERRGEVFRADHVSVEDAVHLRNAYRDRFDAWQKAGAEQLDLEVPQGPRNTLLAENAVRRMPDYRVGHLASGPLVVSSKQFAEWLLVRDEKLEAVEMEAAGVAAAAWERAGPIPAILIRGISDLADGNKYSIDAVGGGALRRLAMANASRFLLELLAALRDREPPHVPTDARRDSSHAEASANTVSEPSRAENRPDGTSSGVADTTWTNLGWGEE